MSTQFKLRGGVPDGHAKEQAALIAREMGLPRFVATVLVSRGIDTPEAAAAFLSPSLERDWLNPYGIEGMGEVADALEAAIKGRKHIVVFGDFDLDGISATTVMTRGIRALGGKVTPFIPSRFSEGYGLTLAALERVKQLGCDVLVTVDCGISCRDEVAAAQKAGISVVVTDHHEASDAVPVGVPLIDPKAQPGNPSQILAGVGVALKVVQALGSRFGFPHLWRSYTDFATLGTVADLMPMRDENRALVSDGLRQMNEAPRPCIAALAAVSGMEGKALTSTNLSFSLVPRLNAAGRMDDAALALDLLMSDSFEEASLLAQKLDAVNTRRRQIEAELSEVALAQAQREYAGERVLVVAGEGWHEGVKGIVASRLVGEYGVPVLLFTIEDGQARGSGRSVGKVNLFEAIESASDLLTRFGGHGAAVGVTLPVGNLPAFKQRLCEHMDALPASEFKPMCEVDAVVNLHDLTIPDVEALDRLAPFGQENLEPVLFAHNVLLDQCRAVGAGKNHFSCTLTDGRAQVGGILFHCSDIESLVATESIVDAAFTAQIDEWRGRRSVKAMLKELVPSRACSCLDACLDEDCRAFVESLFCEGGDGGAAQAAEGAGCVRPAAATAAGDCAPGARQAASDAAAQKASALREHWKQVGRDDPRALKAEVVRAIIGDHAPHATQAQIMAMLEQGHSVLGIMATGRGKSLVFQAHAATIALAEGKASLFVYPLRALMSDQAYNIGRKFARFGLKCAVLNGDTPADARRATYDGLADGTVDIVLTTPEYLSFHAEEVAASGRIGFMVVDEAHHIGQAKAGARPAYKELADVVARLGGPVVLAVTATANDQIAHDIERTLPIGERVVDATSRDNLHVDDQRGMLARDDYLAHIIGSGRKCVIYVNSREQSVGVARRLRRRVPHLAPMIGFYNAGLGREERTRVEDLFREGAIRVLVATSAFGEGIDIPDIRHVVLYHMPFSDVEFNQMAGRAGRDGADSWVHLLYGRQDVSVNRGILEDMTPCRDVMAQVYRRLKALQADARGALFSLGVDDLARLASEARHPVSPSAAACGLSVFSELGLIEATRSFADGAESYLVRVVEDAKKVELTDSVRYREGLDEIEEFQQFRAWAMKCDIHGLTVRVTHPIAPSA